MKDDPSGSKLFRKQALDKLSSPDRLAQRVSLIPSSWWLGLFSLILVLVAALLWAWHGRIAARVHGTGMFLESSGLHTVTANTGGGIGRLEVQEGMVVNEGDVLGAISLPLHEEELRQSRDRLEMMRLEVEELHVASRKERQDRFQYFDRLLADNAETIAGLTVILEKIQEIGTGVDNLGKRGMVTKLESMQVLREIAQTAMDVAERRREMLRQDIQRSEHDLGFKREDWERRRRLLDAEQDVALRLARFVNQSLIVSPVGGKVVAVQKTAGDSVSSGDVIAVLQPSPDGGLYVGAFVPAVRGKSVRPGQSVHVAPGNIDPRRWGYVLGEVREVGRYPTTLEQMTAVLKNPDLARMIQGNSVMMHVNVRLVSAPENPTGWRWTGKPPENVTLTAGTLCTVSFITEQRTPISYVMPWVREKLLGRGSMPSAWESSPVQ